MPSPENTPANAALISRQLAEVHRAAQERLGLTAALVVYNAWRLISATRPELNATFVAEVLLIVHAMRAASRRESARYYNLVRALGTGYAYPDIEKSFTERASLEDLYSALAESLNEVVTATTLDIKAPATPAGAAAGASDPSGKGIAPPADDTQPVRGAALDKRLAELEDTLLTMFQQTFPGDADLAQAIEVETPGENWDWPEIGNEKVLDEDLLAEMEAKSIKALQDIVDRELASQANVADGLATITDQADKKGAIAAAAAERSAMEEGRRLVFEIGNADPRRYAWERVTGAHPCGFCAMLASRGPVYNTAESAGYGNLYHDHCFPAGTLVSGPATKQATRRMYQGEVVILRTAAGHELTCTPNHPVLTDTGWMPADLLEEGDNVVRSLGADGAHALDIPDEHQVPALIEEVWGSDAMRHLARVPGSAEDFHGDGGPGEVEIVFPHRDLGSEDESPFHQEGSHLALPGRALPVALASAGVLPKVLVAAGHSADCVVGGGGELLPLFGGHGSIPIQTSFAPVADGSPVGDQRIDDHIPGAGESSSDRQDGFTGKVGGGDRFPIDREAPRSRWDAPSGHFAREGCRAYSQRGLDLFARLSGQVQVDSIVDIERGEFSGHVYNLSTTEGWYAANCLIVSNCACHQVPVFVSDPYVSERDQYFIDNWETGSGGLSGKQALRAWRTWLTNQYKQGLVPEQDVFGPARPAARAPAPF